MRVWVTRHKISESPRTILIVREYHKLCKNSKPQNIDEWLKVYTQAKHLNITEVSKRKPVSDFLPALKKISPTLLNASLLAFTKDPESFQLAPIEQFRHILRIKRAIPVPLPPPLLLRSKTSIEGQHSNWNPRNAYAVCSIDMSTVII